MSTRDQIRKRAGWKKPFDALWKWAVRPKRARQKSNRFKALQAWTEDKVELARDNKLPHRIVRQWIKRRKVYRRKKAIYDDRADKHQKKNEEEAQTTNGVASPDRPWNPYRKPLAAWMVPKVDAAYSHGWRGTLTSGWRSAAYSTSICYRLCGQPTCPGTCAGAGSAHSGSVYPAGAIDVTDPYGFAAASRAAGTGLHNSLGSRDPWHMSMSGY